MTLTQKLHEHWFNIGFDDNFETNGATITRTITLAQEQAWVQGWRAANLYKVAIAAAK